MEEPSLAFNDKDMVDEDDGEVKGQEIPKFVATVSHEAKLKQLFHNINSIEIKLCSDATKEFIKLLKGGTGEDLLHLYVRTTSKFSELLEAWKLRQGKPGLLYILSLVSAILSHPDGKYKPNDVERIAISRVLDKFARLIFEEKLNDIYKELNSKQEKRQNAALLILASVVRRGSGLASEVAKNFDFKLQAFSKLAENKQRQNEKRRKHSTRKAFVGFAMSFLEVGKPGLLRWVLQQKEMYSGVFRGLGNDDDETVIYVLSTLRDKVLIEGSLVPPGLRSVLFGSVTLEQLVNISGRENGGPAAELARSVLDMVCTHPGNGLMPDLKRHPNPLRGNPKRLLGLMKKLKATNIGYHRDLLLAIVSGRPSFGSAYMEEFPYNLEDHASPTWFAIVSLAANLVSSVGTGLPFGFLNSQFHDFHSFESADVQSVVKCICPRPFSRSVINKGLLHSDFLVKHGTLRLLLEMLKLLDDFTFALKNNSLSSKQMIQSWSSLMQEIQNRVRTLLPDPQVLLTLLSSLSRDSKNYVSCLKRKADVENFPEHSSCETKKLKTSTVSEDTDIIVSGISSVPDIALPRDHELVVGTSTVVELDSEKDLMNVITEIWGFEPCSMPVTTLKDAEVYFHSKLLDALKIYLRTMPTVLEGSFDFFMNLVSDPSGLPANLQRSLLSLLIEYIEWSPRVGTPIKTPPLMYKHLQPFINLLIFSPIPDIKDQAHGLAQAAMLSTGAFDRNLHEVVAWLFFIPGYSSDKFSVKVQGIEVLPSLTPAVISFLCDAISTVGNNIFKYWDIVRSNTYHLESLKDVSPEISPLIICVLQKCLRLLNSESETFTLPEKTMISLYVCNTLKYLMQTQVDARLLSALIESILSERLENQYSVVDASGDFCEWRPLKSLLIFSQCISLRQCCIFSIERKAMPADSSFVNTLTEVKRFLRSGYVGELAGLSKAFSFSIICTTPDGILKNFPPALTMSLKLLRVPVSLLSSVFFLEQSFLASVSESWPEMFFPGLKMAESMIHHESTKDVAYGGPDHSLHAKEKTDFDASESSAAAFSFFLNQVPFHVLFTGIMSIDGPYLLEPLKIQNLLLAKLSEEKADCLISYLRLVLFWMHQIQSSYRTKPMVELEQLSEICFILIEHILGQLLVLKPDSYCSTGPGLPMSNQNIKEVAETIFSHPVAVALLSCPLGCSEELTQGNSGNSLDDFLSLSRQRVHKIDHHVLNILTTTSDYLFSLGNSQHSNSRLGFEDGANKQLAKAFNALIQRLFLELRDRFDICIGTEDLMPFLPTFYALHALIRYISPFELLNLVHWIFSRVDMNDLAVAGSSKISAIPVGFCIAGAAFEILSNYLQQPIAKRVSYDLFWEMQEKSFDVILIESIYIKICKFATCFGLDFADTCLLKGVNAAYTQKHMQHHNLHPLSLVMPRVIMSTPIEVISHCINRVSMTKAKLLSLLIEMSPFHMSVFGCLFLGIMDKDLLQRGTVMEGTCEYVLSGEDFVMLLPAALLYLNSIFMKFGKQYYKYFKSITSFYSRILLKGFHQWRSFVSGHIFQEEYGEFLPSSTGEFLNLFDGSLLGKAINMLQYHLTQSEDSMKIKKRLKLFNSIFPRSAMHDEILDFDVSDLDAYSLNQSLKLLIRVVAKISLCRMLLFPEDIQIQYLPKDADGDLNKDPLEMNFDREDTSRMRFMNILVSSWQCIVKKFPYVSYISGKVKSSDSLRLFKYLEVFILRTILELTTKMCDCLVQLQSIPFLEQLMKFSLLYRFEDPTTLKMLQSILSLLSEGKFARITYLQLLLAHSQFAPTIHSISKSSGCSHIGAFFRPMSSILRSLVIPSTCQNAIDGKKELETTELYLKQLEVIKLLRVLFRFNIDQCSFDPGKDFGINSRELHSLLLSSYGATVSEIDLEIYNLMHEIESIEGSNSGNFAEMDYLWGSAALRVRKERSMEQGISSVIMTDTGTVEERRRSQFRENLPIEPKLCVTTALHFPYDRAACKEPLSLNKLQLDNIMDLHEVHFPAVENIQRYDPVFILQFSIYSLSVHNIEPVEFAGLGLLAVAFVSTSSPNDSIRKLGYETLGRFKNALEKCKKRKDVMRLRLLLTYVQNGVEKPWQRIPSVITLFAAESSFILLDPSHDHYVIISKHLMSSSRVNMKCIPLFHSFFWSGSVNFKAERLWILRLVYTGLNLDDDAQIYIRNCIIEILLSFYASPLSDIESKELILQIVKKSVKLHKMARYLVEHCGLFSWLSSVLSIYSEGSFGDEGCSLRRLVVVLEVVKDVISSTNIILWLQTYALEPLMELSSHLYKLLVSGVKLIHKNGTLTNLILKIMISTLKLSQKRKIYQPHFTISVEGLFQIYQAVNVDDITRSSPNAEFALEAILMCTPPVTIFHMSQEKLSSFLMWSISTALGSDFTQMHQPKETHLHFTIISEEELCEDSLISKLLRWLTASVILGRLYLKSKDLDSTFLQRPNFICLQSLLEYVQGLGESNKIRFSGVEILTATIFYLQQLLGMNCRVLPSVVSALCLLLFDASSFAGSGTDLILGHETSEASLSSKIRYPAEANPGWRWSFYQPWKDHSLELTDLQKIDELHACQTLLVLISNVLGKKSLDSGVLWHHHVEISGVFKWERSIIETE